MPHIRLAAKMIVLERNELDSGDGGGSGAERDFLSASSSCSFFIEQAVLLDDGVYTLKVCYARSYIVYLQKEGGKIQREYKALVIPRSLNIV